MRTVTFSSFSLHRQRCRAILSDAIKARSRWPLGGRESGPFTFFHEPLRHCSRMPSTGPGESGQTGASSLNSELGVCFPQLSSFVTKREQRKLTNSIGGGSLYGGRARPYDSGSARRALPHFVALQGRWVNSEGLLESASDESAGASSSRLDTDVLCRDLAPSLDICRALRCRNGHVASIARPLYLSLMRLSQPPTDCFRVCSLPRNFPR
jgi:hypothetical protein